MNLNELPGSEIILPGLSDLHRGESSTWLTDKSVVASG